MSSYDEVEEVNSGREQRRKYVWLILIVGSCPLGLLFLLHLFSTTVLRMTFIVYAVTVLSYGDSFYVRRKGKLGECWLWKSVVATIPLHVVFVVCIEGLIRLLPSFARTGFTVVAFIALCFGVESVLFDLIADRFDPSRVAQQAS